jgi:hypothetical protein
VLSKVDISDAVVSEPPHQMFLMKQQPQIYRLWIALMLR